MGSGTSPVLRAGPSSPADAENDLAGAGNDLAGAAGTLLRRCDTGRVIAPAPDAPAHQSGWDGLFCAMGLAAIDVRRACAEIDELLRGQWRTGMLPHLVYDAEPAGYFPDADRWDCPEITGAAPGNPRTSGVSSPPLHALAVERIVDAGVRAGGDDAVHVAAWASRIFPALLAWHRYLVDRRDPELTGLLRIYSAEESGMPDSPRWDEAYSHIVVGLDLPPYPGMEQRRGAILRRDERERQRSIWLMEELKRLHYDEERYPFGMSFQMADVLSSAIFAAANDVLARVADALGRPEGSELRRYADRFREGVAGTVDPGSCLARDRDLLHGSVIRTDTVAGFAPLISGGMTQREQQRLTAVMRSPRWLSHPGVRRGVLPTVAPHARGFDRDARWRGPSRADLNWLLVWALEQREEHEMADDLRRQSLLQMEQEGFAEHFDPLSGEALGEGVCAISAAVTLDWLAGARSS